MVLRQLTEDVKALGTSQGLRPDLILVSGDIAFSGQAAEYDLARQFFDALLAAAGATKKQLWIVPGNHDVDRKLISRGAQAIAASLDNRQAIQEVLTNAEDRRLLLRRLDAYARFVNDYFPGRPAFSDEQYYYTQTFNLAGQRVALLGLNSAWLATDDKDLGRLALGEKQVVQALEATREANLRIALMHHPLEWLRELERDDAEARLLRGCGFILHGHRHRTGLRNFSTPDSGAMILAAGAAYETREYANGYHWVRLDYAAGTGTIWLRAYSDKQGGFWTPDVGSYQNVTTGELTFDWPAQTKTPAAAAPRPVSLAAPAKVEANYLRRVQTLSNALPLAVIDPKAVERTRQQSMDLLPLYVSLQTRTSVKAAEDPSPQGKPGRHEAVADAERETRFLSALEAAGGARQIVLLGDPGSGKTTFANYLCLCLAGARLQRLGEPTLLTGENWLSHLEPAWTHGPILPLQITLRQFGASRWCDGTAGGLWNFIDEVLREQDLADFAPHLRRELAEGGVLVLLDGLDEVADPARRRVVRDAVADFVTTYQNPNNRYLVTCRGYAYQDAKSQLAGFPAQQLAPFNQEQIDGFIECWYREVCRLGWKSPKEAKDLTQQLQAATLRPDLAPLTSSPLQLAMMASLHFSWGQLPQDRVQLYQEMVRLLLVRWQEARQGQTTGLVQKLRSIDLESALERVAYTAHQTQSGAEGTADIEEPALRGVLKDYLDGSWDEAGALLAYIQDRAGLLIDRGKGIYTFPHRSYQEYLAGCYLAVRPDYPDAAARLARENYAQWREAILWSVGVMARLKKMLHVAVNVADALCPPEAPTAAVADPDWRLAHLAGEALLEIGLKEVESSSRYVSILDRVRKWLVALIQKGALATKARSLAGVTLGKLGDERPGVVPRSIADLTQIEFCYVPPGRFWRGDGKEAQPDDSLDNGFWISRFPVTVAQFDLFAQAGGYAETQWWEMARKAGMWKHGKVHGQSWSDEKRGLVAEWRDRPGDSGPPFTSPNHPVVNVNWYEAMAFCRWLEARLPLPPGGRIALPSEAEWEKTARGGEQILAQPLIRSVATALTAPASPALERNPDEKRGYPWKGDFDPNRANAAQSEIGATSAVGCFPGGSSPCGAEDLSGNVWEWCADWYDKEQKYRVLRGGSWSSCSPENLRCACRRGDAPGYRRENRGFRCVLGEGGSGATWMVASR